MCFMSMYYDKSYLTFLLYTQIQQSRVTADMKTRAMDPLPESLIQALHEGMAENRGNIEGLCAQMVDIQQRLTSIETNVLTGSP